MAYAVKEVFLTLQGEGIQVGRAAVFCRFAGCNLWSGREEDRSSAACQFCDTDFRGTDGPGGGRFAAAGDLAARIRGTWHDRARNGRPYVVFTGGEPLLQLDEELVAACRSDGFEIAVETNGTIPAVRGIDWVCVSPKARAELVLLQGDELKLVFPQPAAMPEMFEQLQFRHFLLQPMYGPNLGGNTAAAVAYCLANPNWRLSLQTHKLLGIP